MATYDYTKNTSPVCSPSLTEKDGNLTLRNTLNFGVGGLSVAAGDYLSVLTVPAGCVLKQVFFKTITPMSTAGTFSMGDGSDGTCINASTPLNSTAGTLVLGNGTNFVLANITYPVSAATKAFTVDTALQLKLAGALANNGQFEVVAKVFRV